MKYKMINDNLTGGKIPKILDATIDKNDKVDYINKSAPLYFNLNKNPIVSTNNNLYSYDFDYKPDSQVFRIDSNLDLVNAGRFDSLVQPTQVDAYTPSDDDKYRVINVNGEQIPYYLGKIHNKKEFGKLKLLYQYIAWTMNPDDFSNIKLGVLKSETDIINLIESMFLISDDLNMLVGLSKSLNNIVDKYIFISKFYELLEIITWTPPTYTIEEAKRAEFSFINVPNGTSRDNKTLQKNINEENYIQLAPNGNITFIKSILYSNRDHLSDEKKLKYIKFITWIDYILHKLKKIFNYEPTRNEIGKINLINLIDLYSGYVPIFKDDINPKINDNMKVCKYINTIDKTNTKVPTLEKYFYNEAVGLYNFIQTINKIKNWKTGYGLSKINIHLVLLLSYFDIRINQTQISQGKYINAIPINKTEALTNLFGYGRSFIQDISTDTLLTRITADYFSKSNIGPEIIDDTPTISYQDLYFPACVENTILQFVKCLFWDYTRKKFFHNPIGLPEDNFLVVYMDKYMQSDKQTESLVEEFVGPLINLNNIDYVRKNQKYTNGYEYNATTPNFIKTLLMLLKTRYADIGSAVISSNSIDDDIAELKSILEPNGFDIEITDISSSEGSADKIELTKNGDVVIEVNLYLHQHGAVSKPENKINIEHINKYFKNLITYLQEENDSTRCVSCKFWFDTKIIAQTRTLKSKFFNNSNIYWLNFISTSGVLSTIPSYIEKKFKSDQELIDKLNLEYFEILNNILKLTCDSGKKLYQNKFHFLYYYFLYLTTYVDIIKYPTIYENSKEFILNNSEFISSHIYSSSNILELLMVEFNDKRKISSTIYLVNLIKSLDNKILSNYTNNYNIPLHILLNNYIHDEYFVKILDPNILLLFSSLVDDNEEVLYENYGDFSFYNLSILSNFPLYNVLSAQDLQKYLVSKNPDLLINLINICIGSKKIILEKYKDLSSPLEFYINHILKFIPSYITEQKELYYLVYCPILLLQTPNTIKGNEYSISLIYKVMNEILKSKKEIFVYAIKLFIEHKLLIDNRIDGNQPVLNCIQNDKSLLYLYLNNVQPVMGSFDLNVFRYLYNMDLYASSDSPLWGYFTNPNLNCITYDPLIIQLVSSDVIIRGKSYSIVSTELPNGLLPANYLIELIIKLSDTELNTFLFNSNCVMLFVYLCKGISDKQVFRKHAEILNKLFIEKYSAPLEPKAVFDLILFNIYQIITILTI
jgi:hypothetical protein